MIRMLFLQATPFSLIPFLFALQQGPAPVADALNLPTPREHYEEFNVEAHAQALLRNLMRTHPEVQAILPTLLAQMNSGSLELPADFSTLLSKYPRRDWEQEILETTDSSLAGSGNGHARARQVATLCPRLADLFFS